MPRDRSGSSGGKEGGEEGTECLEEKGREIEDGYRLGKEKRKREREIARHTDRQRVSKRRTGSFRVRGHPYI